MAIPIYQVDAFTQQPFAGNPAAVCLLPEARETAWMQLVAREMNLSETAFLTRQDGGFSLRWFTPSVEVELCGHATLASAHILWETGALAPHEDAVFHTLSGALGARRAGEEIELDFPATPDVPATPLAGLCEALGIVPRYVGLSALFWLLEVDSEATLRALQPDFRAMKALSTSSVIVTSRPDSPRFDFASRMFAPEAGIDEDPVCGSAHCCLGPFWGGRLGKDEMLACQVSARGGVVRVRLAGERVRLAGRAVTVLRGELVGV